MLLLDTWIDVICCRSRQVVVLEYNQNCPAVNFWGQYTRRIYMLITSGSWSFCQIFFWSFCQISPKTGNYSDKMPLLDKWIYVIFFIEADKLLYWSTIYTVLLWIFEATPSWPRCKQWSTREKVSQQCLWKMQRNVQMFWFNTVHNEASTYHENLNSKVSINMKIQHFPPPHLGIWIFDDWFV